VQNVRSRYRLPAATAFIAGLLFLAILQIAFAVRAFRLVIIFEIIMLAHLTFLLYLDLTIPLTLGECAHPSESSMRFMLSVRAHPRIQFPQAVPIPAARALVRDLVFAIFTD
jgi:hypothetical protein